MATAAEKRKAAWRNSGKARDPATYRSMSVALRQENGP